MIRLSAVMLIALGVSLPVAIQAQRPCQAYDNGVACDERSFKAALAKVTTVRVAEGSVDRLSTGQLRRYLIARGLTIDSDGAMTFELKRAPITGMMVGQQQIILGTLRVFAKDVDGERGPLLWIENLRGQPDKPWPSQVQELLDQFDERFKRR